MKKKYFIPLLFFVIPTVICSAIMWPPAAMKASLIGGFSLMIFSMIMTYFMGIRLVINDQIQQQPDKKEKNEKTDLN